MLRRANILTPHWMSLGILYTALRLNAYAIFWYLFSILEPGKGLKLVPTLQINYTTFNRCLQGKQNSFLLGALCLHHVGAMSKLAVVGRKRILFVSSKHSQ